MSREEALSLARLLRSAGRLCAAGPVAPEDQPGIEKPALWDVFCLRKPCCV